MVTLNKFYLNSWNLLYFSLLKLLVFCSSPKYTVTVKWLCWNLLRSSHLDVKGRYYGVVGLFCFSLHCFTAWTAEVVSPYFELLRYEMIPSSRVWLDIPILLLRILFILKKRLNKREKHANTNWLGKGVDHSWNNTHKNLSVCFNDGK